MRLQLHDEFQQVKTQDLNDQNDVEIFTTSIRGGKAFAAEQKIKELKTRVTKLSIRKLKISASQIILNSAVDMNIIDSVKYGIIPEEIEKRSLFNEKFKTLFKFHKIEPSKHSSWWRRTEGVLETSWRRLQCNIFLSFKRSWRRLEGIIARRLTNTSWRRLEDVFKTSWRRFRKTYCKYILKTSWKTNSVMLKTSSRRLQDVLENKKRLLGEN